MRIIQPNSRALVPASDVAVARGIDTVISGMRERVKDLGGTFGIQPSGNRIRIHCTIDCEIFTNEPSPRVRTVDDAPQEA